MLVDPLRPPGHYGEREDADGPGDGRDDGACHRFWLAIPDDVFRRESGERGDDRSQTFLRDVRAHVGA